MLKSFIQNVSYHNFQPYIVTVFSYDIVKNINLEAQFVSLIRVLMYNCIVYSVRWYNSNYHNYTGYNLVITFILYVLSIKNVLMIPFYWVDVPSVWMKEWHCNSSQSWHTTAPHIKGDIWLFCLTSVLTALMILHDIFFLTLWWLTFRKEWNIPKLYKSKIVFIIFTIFIFNTSKTPFNNAENIVTLI